MEKVNSKVLKQFHKRFAYGEQYLIIYNNKIQEDSKSYYWQQRDVYNHILPIIEYLKCKYELNDNIIYGKNGIVQSLVDIQKSYNAVMNRSQELINQQVYSPLFVEDGSIDIDDIEEEGLAPGKILVYRQGAKSPVNFEVKFDSYFLESYRDKLLMEFQNITNMWETYFKNNNMIKEGK